MTLVITTSIASRVALFVHANLDAEHSEPALPQSKVDIA